MPPTPVIGSPAAASMLARISARLGGGGATTDDEPCIGSFSAAAADALREDVRQRRRASVTATRGGGVGQRHANGDGRPSWRQPLLAGLPTDDLGAAQPPPTTSASAVLHGLLLSSKLNVLLLAGPLAAAAHGLLHWGPLPVFVLAFLALIPLASLLSMITEELAGHLGDTAGGLILATSGNIPELAVSISALRRGLFDVVSVSLMGSILSNMLLVLGCCHIAGSAGGGGSTGRCPRHGTLAVKAYSSMLLLACAGLSVGTVTAHFPHDHLRPGGALAISRGVAVLLLLMYGAFLVFTMGTHARRLETEAAAAAAASAAENGGGGEEEDEDDDNEDDDDGLLHLPLATACVAMAVVTVAVGVVSELLTGAIGGVVDAGVPARLLSLVVLPIAANATEHASSVIVAYKGKMDLAHSIALGSSLQIATFVLPLCVVAAAAMNIPYTLELDPLLFLLLLLSVLHQQSVSADGRSDWLTGTQLVCLYMIVALPSAFMKA